MNARCKECNKLIHFGGRGTKLSELCHIGQCEMVYYNPTPYSHYINRNGEKFDPVSNMNGSGILLVKRIDE